jgi:hypothetical protein
VSSCEEHGQRAQIRFFFCAFRGLSRTLDTSSLCGVDAIFGGGAGSPSMTPGFSRTSEPRRMRSITEFPPLPRRCTPTIITWMRLVGRLRLAWLVRIARPQRWLSVPTLNPIRVSNCVSASHTTHKSCAHTHTRKPVLLYDPLPGEAEPLAVEAVSREVECGRQQRECEVYVCVRACVRQGVVVLRSNRTFLG